MTTFQHIRRPSDVWPGVLLDEYRRIAKEHVGPIATIEGAKGVSEFFKITFHPETPLRQFLRNGQDHAALTAGLEWIRQGPKIVHVTEREYEVLSKVDVRLELRDFSMPYPTVLVSMPPGHTHRYCLVHRHSANVLILVNGSSNLREEIVTLARQREGRELESYLEKFEADCENMAVASCQTMRVACNMLLAMTNYGVQSEFLFPREVEQEKKYIAKGDRAGRDGRCASDRLREAPVLLSLHREVRLCHEEGSSPRNEGSTGREMPFHWRRGHWAMVPCGKGRTERRRILRMPVMVRADKAVGGESVTVYR